MVTRARDKDRDDDDQRLPTRRTCGTMPVNERLLRTVPGYAEARAASETHAWEFATMARASHRTGVTVIPVVVHVVWNTNAQNISDAQIQSQITILNQDFRRTNADISGTPGVFQPLIGDARIEFELAKTDPSGNPTTGIVRVKTNKTSFTDDDGVKSSGSGGSNAWPAADYLNIWVCPLGGGLLGYAQFPGGPAATDGVVIRHSAFGNTGTAAAPFNLGRTATHEIGHWLNLRHIWGDDGTGCNGSDFVADTPNCAGENVGMPAFPHVTCNNGPNGDLFMNYMDYTDDAGMFMFTNGQVTRMQACLDTDRASIGHPKPGPTLAFVDVKPTLVVLDIKPTIATIDIKPTLAVVDVKPTLAVVDVKPTLAVLDVGPTAPVVDVGPTNPIRDAGPTIAAIDAGPTLGAADLPQVFPGSLYDPGPMPFALATPHHTNAWIASHRALAEQEIDSLAAQAEEIERALLEFAQADAEGRLSVTEASTAEQLHGEYQRLIEELRALGAFDG